VYFTYACNLDHRASQDTERLQKQIERAGNVEHIINIIIFDINFYLIYYGGKIYQNE